MRERIANLDFVTAGRLLGAAIIIAGIVLAMFDASAGENVSRVGSHPKLRTFLQDSLTFVWSGGLLIVVTELLARLSGDNGDLPIDWNIAELVRILGLVILVLGTFLALWQVHAIRSEPDIGFVSNRLSNAASVRLFLRLELQEYVWQGGLLIIIASLAERIGWRSQGEEEEHVAPEAPPLSPPA